MKKIFEWFEGVVVSVSVLIVPGAFLYRWKKAQRWPYNGSGRL
ncbi:hypothetical protein [Acetobacter oeni]|nr:hypothetical protein [Acetobacter oeni]